MGRREKENWNENATALILLIPLLFSFFSLSSSFSQLFGSERSRRGRSKEWRNEKCVDNRFDIDKAQTLLYFFCISSLILFVHKSRLLSSSTILTDAAYSLPPFSLLLLLTLFNKCTKIPWYMAVTVTATVRKL